MSDTEAALPALHSFFAKSFYRIPYTKLLCCCTSSRCCSPAVALAVSVRVLQLAASCRLRANQHLLSAVAPDCEADQQQSCPHRVAFHKSKLSFFPLIFPKTYANKRSTCFTKNNGLHVKLLRMAETAINSSSNPRYQPSSQPG